MSRNRGLFVTLALMMGLLLSCGTGFNSFAGSDDINALVQSNNLFALDLYASLKANEGNLFLSPYSVSCTLALVYAGARGETAAEMEKVLHFGLKDAALHKAFAALTKELNARTGAEGAIDLAVANSVWIAKAYPVLPAYLQLAQTDYAARIASVDFASDPESARQAINLWVEEQTKDKIKDLLQKGVIDRLTRMVMANAIYFKGKWARPFNKEATKDGEFTLADGNKATVPMMHEKRRFKYSKTESFQVLEIPYAGESLSMVILLPGKRDGLPALEQSLTAENLAGWLDKLSLTTVDVSLPRFKITRSFLLADSLRAMGMAKALSLPPADFSGIDGGKNLFVGEVVHQAFVDVNEEGTEAAAATAAVVKFAARETRVEEFHADRPFVFLIRDKATKNILFIGRVSDPRP